MMCAIMINMITSDELAEATEEAPGLGLLEERRIKILAWQKRSLNFGSGGRIVEMPTDEDLESLTPQEIEEAQNYTPPKTSNV